MEARLSLKESYTPRPSTLLNSIFMSTVKSAAKSLVALASSSDRGEKWRAVDHLRYMVMLTIWFTVWVLRVLMDYLPAFSVVTSPRYLPHGIASSFGSYACSSLLPSSSSSPSVSSLELVLSEALVDGVDASSPLSSHAIGRALSHIFGLINEIPATSTKYQFAVTMADRILDENARDGHLELLQINRTVLSYAFERTSTLLYASLRREQSEMTGEKSTWPARVINTLPLGSYAMSYLKGLFYLVTTVFAPGESDTCLSQKRSQLGIASGEGRVRSNECVAAESHAHELLWITNKLRACAAADEALTQWSSASDLASVSLTANPRVQGFIVKISAILFQELARREIEAPRQVKFRMLVLWLPLLCYASNGLAYPNLTSLEKVETERVMEEVISSLPTMDQEIILTNWLQDFTSSTSDWPNLQSSFDRWCRSSRKIVSQPMICGT